MKNTLSCLQASEAGAVYSCTLHAYAYAYACFAERAGATCARVGVFGWQLWLGDARLLSLVDVVLAIGRSYFSQYLRAFFFHACTHSPRSLSVQEDVFSYI